MHYNDPKEKSKRGLCVGVSSEGLSLEAVTDFLFFGSKITVDFDCSHEFERYLLLGRKAMTKLDSILKYRDITLPMRVHTVEAMFFFSSHVQM